MHIMLVHIHVKEGHLAEFIDATLDNVQNSLKEPGIKRFDFYQMAEDPTRFSLVEVYSSQEDHAKHRETPHYLKWRDTVAAWMADPRQGIKYKNISPIDAQWS